MEIKADVQRGEALAAAQMRQEVRQHEDLRATRLQEALLRRAVSALRAGVRAQASLRQPSLPCALPRGPLPALPPDLRVPVCLRRDPLCPALRIGVPRAPAPVPPALSCTPHLPPRCSVALAPVRLFLLGPSFSSSPFFVIMFPPPPPPSTHRHTNTRCSHNGPSLFQNPFAACFSQARPGLPTSVYLYLNHSMHFDYSMHFVLQNSCLEFGSLGGQAFITRCYEYYFIRTP